MAPRAKPHPDPHRYVRLETLVRLRWLAVIGQATAVLAVQYGLDFDLPVGPCLTLIGLSAWLNVALTLRDRMTPRIIPYDAAWLLAFDIGQHALLLYFTGGLQNPFAFLFLGPMVVAAMALPARYTLLLGALAVTCATLLLFWHEPLPWDSDELLDLPPLYMLGIWLSILLALLYLGVYAWQVAEGARRLSDALAATELTLAREQHLSQLDGLAAAAAHELATPLSTIAVIAKELSLKPGLDNADDIRLLHEETQRCREILGKLTQLSTTYEPFDRAPLGALLDDVVAPHRNFGIEIDIVLPPEHTDEPVGRRNPALLYGLGNLIDNAVDFAKSRVEVTGRWTDKEVTITVADDGPGFAPDVIDRLGEPYITTRGIRPHARADQPSGLGLGFFIAKTLLERSGATIAFANRAAPDHGAVVRIRWERGDFETATAADAFTLEADA
jgi:two-component system sensor histidine kinase RegB